jgi:hypothetical protein
MAGDPLQSYRNPASMVCAVIGTLVMFGGLWTHSDGLALLGILTILIGGKAFEWLASPERAPLRDKWNRFLDDFRDSSCLLLNVIAVPFILWGFWTHRTVSILAGLVIAGAGHYYVQRSRQDAVKSGSSPEDVLP